jgi:23S rRNA pseudouridine2605 synthase
MGSAKPAGRDSAKPAGRGAAKPAGRGAAKPAGRGAAKPAGRGAAKPAGRGAAKPLKRDYGKPAGDGSRLEAGTGHMGPKRTGPWKAGSDGNARGKVKRVASTGLKSDDDSIRLNKYIAASGICSRREADQLISAGLITVNGKSVTELGTKVSPGDDVRYNGKRMRNERKVYLLLNKPKDYVTTTDDPRERKTVMLLIRGACKERIYPVGRLDRQTTGVLLFTNDGEMAKKLTHPGHNKKKIYHVFLDKGISGGDLQKLADGITLEDGFIQPDAISYVSPDNKREIGLEIHSGRNRIVRRMFEHFGYRVTKLDRVYFAGLTKKNLPRGKWRFLTEKEVNRLKMNAYV